MYYGKNIGGIVKICRTNTVTHVEVLLFKNELLLFLFKISDFLLNIPAAFLIMFYVYVV